jgi:hypothetical protein
MNEPYLLSIRSHHGDADLCFRLDNITPGLVVLSVHTPSGLLVCPDLHLGADSLLLAAQTLHRLATETREAQTPPRRRD